MSPELAIHDSLNTLKAHAVNLSNGLRATAPYASLVEGANFKNLFLGKLGRWSIFSARLRSADGATMLFASGLPAFRNLVRNIVIISAKEKVVRIATCAIIAMMHALYAFRDWTNHQLVHYSMGIVSAREATKLAVSIPRLDSRPNPAFSKVGLMWRDRPVGIYVEEEHRGIFHNKKNTHRTQCEVPHSDAALNPMGVKLVSLFRSHFKAFIHPLTINLGGQVE